MAIGHVVTALYCHRMSGIVNGRPDQVCLFHDMVAAAKNKKGHQRTSFLALHSSSIACTCYVRYVRRLFECVESEMPMRN